MNANNGKTCLGCMGKMPCWKVYHYSSVMKCVELELDSKEPLFQAIRLDLLGKFLEVEKKSKK